MFRLTIDTDNDAFGRTTKQEAAEVARCLLLVVTLVEQGKREGNVYDHNGNTVGQWTLDAMPDASAAMLDALRKAYEFKTLPIVVLQMISAAIAKAEGRADK